MRFEQAGELSWRGGTSQHSEKIEVMINSGVDGYTKTLNDRKILQKIPTENQKILETKYKPSGVRILHLARQKGDLPLRPPSVTPLAKML